ncbi:MAG TPA: DinB family protein [Holophagaceae bacterium]|nr:DinB family protein [Holophagaceae bacterium]
MYRRIDDFRKHWQEEVEDTLKVLNAIPDAKLDQAVTPEHRDLRRLAWHLASSIVSLPAELGLTVDGPKVSPQGADLETPSESIRELRAVYAKAAASLLEQLKGWDDADLLVEDTMFGHMVWARGYSLMALAMHQAHHRGQMTVLMRQAGLRVPEFYGPTKESWAGMGVPAPTV